MSNNNPLQKYFRQPKLFITLPSKGLYYPPGVFQGDYNNVPIFAMTGMDEIIMKTPDALFNGESTVRVIESCCPYIKKAKHIPSIDVDTFLLAIKLATYGEKITVAHTCTSCSNENHYEFDLRTFIDHFGELKFINHLTIDENLSIKIKPLNYEQISYFNLENFKLQKTLSQVGTLDDEDKKIQVIDQVFADLSELQLTLFLTAIESIHADGQIVTDQTFILDYLKNVDREIYNKIKEKLEENKSAWNLPLQDVKCGECSATNKVDMVLDQSNFFV
jgi:hypothetical protein